MRNIRCRAVLTVLGLLLLTQPVSTAARAELVTTLTAISYVSQGLSVLISLGSSNRQDPVTRAVFQNRRMLQKLNRRLQGYDRALSAILIQLSHMPEHMRRAVAAEFTSAAVRGVHAAISNIQSDLNIQTNLVAIREGPESFIGNAQSRLNHLQETGAYLLQHEDDAAILVTAILAFEMEKIMISIQPRSDEVHRANLRGRARLYSVRIERVLEKEHKGSLADVIATRYREINDAYHEILRIRRSFAQDARPVYTRARLGHGVEAGPHQVVSHQVCHPEYVWRVSGHVEDTQAAIEAVDRKLHNCPKNFENCPTETQKRGERLRLRTLRYLERLARHQLFIMEQYEEPLAEPAVYRATPKQTFIRVHGRYFAVDPLVWRTAGKVSFVTTRDRVRQIEDGLWPEVSPLAIPVPTLPGERELELLSAYEEAKRAALRDIDRISNNHPTEVRTFCSF